MATTTTTQILFNSPALHSLKRDQLVRLCKIHSLKANGKNVDMIQRLRDHAKDLPKDSPLSIAARSEDGNENSESDSESDFCSSRPPRPSEQWEVVMDSIKECDENSSQGTMSSQRTLNNDAAGEFGTGSSKSTTVSSSIKALATSLGLKRTTSKPTSGSVISQSTGNSLFSQPQHLTSSENDILSQPYASLSEHANLPQTDHFTLDSGRLSLGGPDGSPLPGHSLRPGVPAPANARLSLGLGLGVPATPTRRSQPTTTIRLVSDSLASQEDVDMSGFGENGTPVLQPFKTNFDITFGSPIVNNAFNFGFGNLNSWPPSTDKDEDVQMGNLYPKLTFDDLPPSVVRSPSQLPASVNKIPGHLSTPPKPTTTQNASPSPHFVFGSPRHSMSNHQFRSAASSVLEEMNARLRSEGVDEINLSIVDKLHPDRKVAVVEQRDVKPIPNPKRGELKNKFDKAHDEEFGKMEGIDSTLKKRQERRQPSSPQKSEKETERIVGQKRKSSVLESDIAPRRPSAILPKSRGITTRVISNGRRAKVLPGGFGMDDDEEDEKESQEQSRAGKRMRMDPEDVSALKDQREKEQNSEQQVKKVELKKKAEAIRAARRSSAAGRTSIGGARRSIGKPGARTGIRASLVKQNPKPSKFGFFSSAKSMVQNMWNRGKAPTAVSGASNLKSASSSNDVAPTKPRPTPGPTEGVTADKDEGKAKAAPSILPKTVTTAPSRGTSSSNSRAHAISNNAKESTNVDNDAMIVSPTCSRPPLPSLGTMSSLASGSNSRKSIRVSSLSGSAKSRILSPGSSRVSSVGTRSSIASRTSNGGAVGSMGLRKAALEVAASRASTTGSTGTKDSVRSSTSRLMAPTVSSLAKSSKKVSAIPSPKVFGLKEQGLGSITNSPTVRSPLARPSIPRASKITSPTPSRPGAIFSLPLLLPGQSGIPTPIKKRSVTPVEVNEDGVVPPSSENPTSPTTPARTRSLNGRKPRISRSKVIARLASQREASTSSRPAGHTSSSAIKPRASGGRTRSSLGAKATRASYGGAGVALKGSSSGSVNIAMSAKRRARQSEYMRRKSGKDLVGTEDSVQETISEAEMIS